MGKSNDEKKKENVQFVIRRFPCVEIKFRSPFSCCVLLFLRIGVAPIAVDDDV